MSQRGSGLLDAVAATAVALTIGAASTDLTGALRTLANVSHDAFLGRPGLTVLDAVPAEAV